MASVELEPPTLAATPEAAGFPELHFHDLRHFHVSYVRAMGLPSAVTEQLVGHSDSKTHRTYTHALEGRRR